MSHYHENVAKNNKEIEEYTNQLKLSGESPNSKQTFLLNSIKICEESKDNYKTYTVADLTRLLLESPRNMEVFHRVEGYFKKLNSPHK